MPGTVTTRAGGRNQKIVLVIERPQQVPEPIRQINERLTLTMRKIILLHSRYLTIFEARNVQTS